MSCRALLVLDNDCGHMRWQIGSTNHETVISTALLEQVGQVVVRYCTLGLSSVDHVCQVLGKQKVPLDRLDISIFGLKVAFLLYFALFEHFMTIQLDFIF